MIQKESCVQIVRHIDLEFQSLLTNCSNDFGLTDPFVLRDSPLALTMLDEEMTWINLKRSVNVVEAQSMKFSLGFRSVVASARMKPDQNIAVVPINDQRKLWNIPFIESKARRIDSPRPFLKMTHSLFETMIKHGVNNSFWLSNYR